MFRLTQQHEKLLVSAFRVAAEEFDKHAQENRALALADNDNPGHLSVARDFERMAHQAREVAEGVELRGLATVEGVRISDFAASAARRASELLVQNRAQLVEALEAKGWPVGWLEGVYDQLERLTQELK